MAIRSPFDLFDEMDRTLDEMRRSMWARGDDRWMGTAPGRGDRWMGMTPRGDVDASVSGRSRTHDAGITVEETDEGYVVLADVPGFERDELDVRYDEDDRMVHVTGEHEVTDEYSTRRRRVSEHVRIPGDVMVDGIAATYRNGVLELTLPAMDHGDADEGHRIDID